MISDFPNLPSKVEDQTEILIRNHNPKLVTILRQLTLLDRLWESLCALFTDLFGKQTWLYVFDFLFAFSDFPELFYFIIPAVVIEFESDLIAFARNHGLLEDTNRSCLETISGSEQRDPLGKFLEEAESFLQETGNILKSETDKKIADNVHTISHLSGRESESRKIDDSEILARTLAAEELVYEDKIAHLDKQIGLRLHARSPNLIAKKNAFVNEMVEKTGRLSGSLVIRRINGLLKTAYQKKLLVLRFKDCGGLEGGGNLRYPIYPYIDRMS